MFQKLSPLQVCNTALTVCAAGKPGLVEIAAWERSLSFYKFQTAKAQAVGILQDSSATATLLAWVIFWATF